MADGMTELFEESGVGYTVSHCLDQGLPVRLAAAQFVDADAAGGQIHFQADQSVRPQRIDQPAVPQALCPALSVGAAQEDDLACQGTLIIGNKVVRQGRSRWCGRHPRGQVLPQGLQEVAVAACFLGQDRLLCIRVCCITL